MFAERHSVTPFAVCTADPKKEIMNKEKILINHWRWLEARGYKQQAASCKRQAASLTRKNYNVIGESRRKKNENK